MSTACSRMMLTPVMPKESCRWRAARCDCTYAKVELSGGFVEAFAGVLQFLCQGVEDHVTLQQAMQGQQQAELQRLVQASGKMVLLDKLLPKLRGEGHKVARPPAPTCHATNPLLSLPAVVPRLTIF